MVLENFNLSGLHGIWFKKSVVSLVLPEKMIDYVIDIGKSDNELLSADTAVRYKSKNGQCKSEKIVIHQPGSSGKLLTTRTTPTGIIQQESYVMGTDYTSYFVEYQCLEQDENSKCSNPIAILWTRTLTLRPEAYVESRKVIIGLCLDLDKLVDVEHFQQCPASKGEAISLWSILISFPLILLII